MLKCGSCFSGITTMKSWRLATNTAVPQTLRDVVGTSVCTNGWDRNQHSHLRQWSDHDWPCWKVFVRWGEGEGCSEIRHANPQWVFMTSPASPKNSIALVTSSPGHCFLQRSMWTISILGLTRCTGEHWQQPQDGCPKDQGMPTFSGQSRAIAHNTLWIQGFKPLWQNPRTANKVKIPSITMRSNFAMFFILQESC